MNFPTQLVLNGKLQAASDGKILPVINPATEETLCEAASASTRDVEIAAAGGYRRYSGR